MTGLVERLKLPAAIVAASTATWAILDYLDVRPVLSREFGQLAAVVESVQQGVQLGRWQVLDARRRAQGLDAAEQAEFCRLSRALGFRADGCA